MQGISAPPPLSPVLFARAHFVISPKYGSDVTSLHFQAAVPKYLRLEMQAASGSVVRAGGASMVEQVVRITNSMPVRAVRPLHVSLEKGGLRVYSSTGRKIWLIHGGGTQWAALFCRCFRTVVLRVVLFSFWGGQGRAAGGSTHDKACHCHQPLISRFCNAGTE